MATDDIPKGVIMCGPPGSSPTSADLVAVGKVARILQEKHAREQAMTTEQSKPEGVDLAPVAGWIAVLDQVAERRRELDEVEAKAREEIQALMGDAVDGLVDGQPVIRWSHTKGARRFNAKRFRTDHPELAEQYYEVGPPGRRFERIKPQEDDK